MHIRHTNANRTHNIRVITFNLLSQKTINSVFFPHVSSNYSNFNYRVEKTKNLIESWIRVNFIICLQEVSEQWKTVLQPIFAENRYGFESHTYANGIMGIGIAYPHNHYDVLQKDEFICGDAVKPIYQAIQAKYDERDLTINNNVLYIESEKEMNMKHIINELHTAMEYKNVLLTILLRCKFKGIDTGKKLLVATYHMPCRFRMKYFLISHINSFKIRLHELSEQWSGVANLGSSNANLGSSNANLGSSNTNLELSDDKKYTKYEINELPVVLAGDFNISAKSPEYKFLAGVMYSDTELMTNTSEHGESIEFIRNAKKLYKIVGYDIDNGMRFKSVHRTIRGSEPLYTNVSLKLNSTFVECIDYILVNNLVDIRSCIVGLTVNDPGNTPYPNGLCPSDHLPLSASLCI